MLLHQSCLKMASRHLLLTTTRRTLFPARSSRILWALTQARFQTPGTFDVVKNRFASNFFNRLAFRPNAVIGASRRPRRQITRGVVWEVCGRSLTSIGISIAVTIVALCLVHSDEVRMTRRKRLRCLNDAAIAPRESELFPPAANALRRLDFARNSIPSGIWSDEHPKTMMAKEIFERLVKAQGLQDLGWEIYVLDAQSMFS